MKLHIDILDSVRQAILPLFQSFSDDGFYLAGGTGLALQVGHRDSVDFDFFKEGDYDTGILAEKLTLLFKEHNFVITQEEKNTLSCVIDKSIQLSFFGYKQTLLQPPIKTVYFNIASIDDIGCMKLVAITSRSVEKDYVDLYFILQTKYLSKLLDSCTKKYPTLDSGLILKSLVYFDDVLHESIMFKEGHKVSFETIKSFLQKTVKDYFKK